jgi:hypothetical protein
MPDITGKWTEREENFCHILMKVDKKAGKFLHVAGSGREG